MPTDTERLQAAINLAREEKRPSLDEVLSTLSTTMDAARNSADAQVLDGFVVLDAQAYRGLYYAAYDLKRWIERAK